ncbi:MAG: hydroxymethylpyrimidine/phosphomethylpyrimidine kinase [Myxococcales bacterium]|nr:hydroxymethylpyrimidine/phosphomethylpyrimidine kinase [Myxococcales bacterium]
MKILVIAGLDPVGGAGIVADLDALADLKIRAGVIVTALCAQNSSHVASFNPVSPEIIDEQLQMVRDESEPTWLKVGMLASSEQIERLGERLRPWRGRIVIDPVLRTSSGAAPLHDLGIDALRQRLFPLAALVTPNLPEAHRLLDLTEATESPARLAQALFDRYGVPFLVKGGHLAGSKIDYLYDGALHLYEPEIPGLRAHRGTGCRLASHIAGDLSLGCPLIEAVRRGKHYIERYLFENLDRPHPPVFEE